MATTMSTNWGTDTHAGGSFNTIEGRDSEAGGLGIKAAGAGGRRTQDEVLKSGMHFKDGRGGRIEGKGWRRG